METTGHTSKGQPEISAKRSFMEHLQKAAIDANTAAGQARGTAGGMTPGQAQDSPRTAQETALPGNTDRTAEDAPTGKAGSPAESRSSAPDSGASGDTPSAPDGGASGDTPSALGGSTSETDTSAQDSSAAETDPAAQGGVTSDTSPAGQDGSTSETDMAALDSSASDADTAAPDGSTSDADPAAQADGAPETDPAGQDGEAPAEEAAGAHQVPYKKIAKYAAAGAAAVLLLTYLGVSFFFQKHFLFHTVINGEDFSCKTPEEAHAFFAGQADDYTLEIIESGQKTERIQGKEISMAWDDNLKLDYILDKQNAFAWPLEFFKEKSEDVVFQVSCDETALSKKVDQLDAVTKEPTPPQSAYPKFDGNAFVIEPEVYGTALDPQKLKTKTLELMLDLEESLDLQEEGFYEKPEYTTESEEMLRVCKTLNDYCRASITYEMDTPVVVDKALISTWLSVDDNLNVTLDEAAVRNWVLEFDARYDTLGATRPLTTPTGRATEVSGGTYGWSINEDEEFAVLLNSIRNGEVLTRTPSYSQTAASHAPQDWGNTFLEVDLTAQHMWYLRDGAVVFESDVVTGSTPGGMGTPAGVYTILEKLSPTVLVGNIVPATGKPEYRTPVDYWMRVTYSGIGFHDATWQPAFGGDVYLWNGSHGCINMPYYSAQELYSIIEVGLPVVIHY